MDIKYNVSKAFVPLTKETEKESKKSLYFNFYSKFHIENTM